MKVLTRVLLTTCAVCLLASVSLAQKNPDIPCVRLGTNPDGCLQSKYDKFDRVTMVTLSLMPVYRDELFLSVYGQYPGTEPTAPLAMVVAFQLPTPAPGQRLADDCRLTILAGERRLEFPVVPASATVNEGTRVVTMVLKMSPVDFKIVAAAATVDMRLDTIEFSLTSAQIGRLREFLKRFGEK